VTSCDLLALTLRSRLDSSNADLRERDRTAVSEGGHDPKVNGTTAH